jgi:hypothetical protein
MEIGRQAAEELPEWAVAHLGAPPREEAQREEWIRRAGIAGAYRELRSVPETSLALGAAPSREQEFHRALWQQAYAALGKPTDSLDYHAATETELREMRNRWQREQTWAPYYVADELQQAYSVAADYRADAALARAQVEQLDPAAPMYAESVEQLELAERLAEEYAERARQLEEVHLARGNWFDATEDARLAADMATDELKSRDVPLEPEPERQPEVGQLALFEIADEAEVGPDPGPAEPVVATQRDQEPELVAEHQPGPAAETAEHDQAAVRDAQVLGEEPAPAEVGTGVTWWRQWAAKLGAGRDSEQAEEVEPVRPVVAAQVAAAEPAAAAPEREQERQPEPAREQVKDQLDPNQLELFPLPTAAVVGAQRVREHGPDRRDDDLSDTLAEARRQARIAEQHRIQREAAEKLRAEQHAREQAQEIAEAERRRRDEATRQAEQEQQRERERERQPEQKRERDQPELELVRTDRAPQRSPERRRPVSEDRSYQERARWTPPPGRGPGRDR